MFDVSFADATEALDALDVFDALEAFSDALAAALDDVLDGFDDAGAFDAAQPVSPATRSIDAATADKTSVILFMLPTFRFRDGAYRPFSGMVASYRAL